MIFSEPEPFDAARSPLDFIAKRTPNRDTTVHIRVPLEPSNLFIGGKENKEGAYLLYTRTLCGRRVLQREYDLTGTFNDERICMRCHKAMGEHAIRIFERELLMSRSYREYTGENY